MALINNTFKLIATALVLSSTPMLATSASLGIVESFSSPGGVSQLAFSAQTNQLIIRNAGSAIKVLDLGTRQVTSTQMANTLFTDMDLTTSGRYVYAADYGYEHIGYGTPVNQHYVHRLDLNTNTWSRQTTNRIAGRLEAVDDQRFVLQSLDQWVDLSVNQWGAGAAVNPIGSEAWSGVYSGDIQYDETHGRVLHGSYGISSPEVTAFRLNGNALTRQEDSGTYGVADVPGSGDSVVLASDDSALYYGALQFDPLDMTFLRLTFAERIIGANGQYAFGSQNYYDALTGELVGSLHGNFTSFAFSKTSADIWGFDASTNKLVHFAPVPEASSIAMGIGGLALMSIWRRRQQA